jgi:O-antigen ligase
MISLSSKAHRSVPPKQHRTWIAVPAISLIVVGYAALFSLSPLLPIALLAGGVGFALFCAKPVLATFGLILTIGFGSFLALPVTRGGLALSTMVLVFGVAAVATKGVVSRDSRLVALPLDKLRHVLVLLLLMAILLSLVNSHNMGVSLAEIQRFIYCAAIFFMVIFTIRDQGQLRTAILLFLWSGALVALAGLLQVRYESIYAFFGYKSFFGADILLEAERIQKGRLTGFAFGGNIHGVYMAIIVVLSACWFVYTESKPTKWIMGILMLAGFFNVIGSASRGPMLAVCIALFIMWLLTKPFRKWLALFCGLLIGIFFCAIALGLDVERLYKFESKQKETAEYRWHGILTGLLMVPAHPIIGSGPYGYELNYHRLAVRGAVPEAGKETLRLHNAYLEVLVDYGIVGFSIFVAFVIVVTKPLFVLGRTLPGKERHLVVGVFCCVCAYSLFMFTTGWLVNQVYWLIMGIGCSACNIYERHISTA